MADAAPLITKAELNPYGLTVEEVVNGVERAYTLLFEINNFLVGKGLDRLEDLLLGNSLSGMVSEILVKSVSDCSKTLIRNEKVGGHPDLVPRGMYEGDAVLRGERGVEIKSSKQRGGWQGHNPEDTDLIVFRYILGHKDEEPAKRVPITFVQILGAGITKAEWSFSGRKGESRRTITASITEVGMHKLRSNPIYQEADYIAGRREAAKAYRALNEKFSRRTEG
jgi:hypothetical protein